MIIPQCTSCKHFIRRVNARGLPQCAAFPDGIPEAILDAEHDHREPYPGDNGIRFEPVPELNAPGSADPR